MKALLDTHAFLWWILDDKRLSSRARDIITDGNNELFFSAASGWEIAIKSKLGRIKLPGEPATFIISQLAENSIQSLPVRMNHALYVAALPDFHRDPFDRLLVAQAKLEKLSILTADPQMAGYGVQIIW